MIIRFVYKRRKRKHVSPPPIPTKTTFSKLNDDQYIKQHRRTKKEALLNLKEKCAKEIRDWESLSQMLQKTPISAIPSMKEPATSLALLDTNWEQLQICSKGTLTAGGSPRGLHQGCNNSLQFG